MRFVSRFDPVQMGEIVLTSGLDGAFPEGIPIGRVVAIHRNPGDIFQRIEIHPVASLNSIEEVIVFCMPEMPDPEKAAADTPAGDTPDTAVRNGE